MKYALFLIALLSAKSSALACSALPQLTDILPALKPSMEVAASLDQAWKLKLDTRALMKKDYDSGVFTHECHNQYKQFFIDLRSYEDRVAILGKYKGMKSTDTPYTWKNPQLKTAPGAQMIDMRKDLQSGDIIVSRGNAYTSAAISHLGDFNQQFSHMSFVYKDPKTGTIYTTEAHIEIGVVAKPLQANIDEMNSRAVIYRYQDQAVAHRAAEYMFKLASAVTEKTGQNIDYDFAMETDNHKELFCSEVVSMGFERVTKKNQQPTRIPLYRTDLTTRNIDFQRSIGITAKDSFMPADLEVDPRFTMIGEWKDWARVRDLIEKDAFTRSLFSWMDNLGYELDQSWNGKVLLRKTLGYGLRHTPGLSTLVDDQMPLNMSRNLLGIFTVLDQVGETVQGFLTHANDVYLARSKGILMSEEGMMSLMEKMRARDAASNYPLFTQHFTTK